MSSIKERVDEILNKPMSRQQFLKQVGLLALTVVGVTSILNTFEGKNSSRQVGTNNSDGMAYGASVYAGGKRPVNL